MKMTLSALIEIKGNLINQANEKKKKQDVEPISINERSTLTSLPKCQNGSCQELVELLVVMLLSMLPPELVLCYGSTVTQCCCSFLLCLGRLTSDFSQSTGTTYQLP